VKVGDLIQCEDYLGGAVSTGVVCMIEKVKLLSGDDETRYWTLWDDSDYAWVADKDNPWIISEANHVE